MHAGTEGNVREAMRGAWAVVGGVCGMVDTHWGAVSRNHVALGHGFDSTRSRHPLPVAVQGERGQRLRARHC